MYYGAVHGELGHEHVHSLTYHVRGQTIPMSCDRLRNDLKEFYCQHNWSLEIILMVLETKDRKLLKGTKLLMKLFRLYLENFLEHIGTEVTLDWSFFSNHLSWVLRELVLHMVQA